jgi:hypothetical protein
MNPTDPDYMIELYWFGFKQSMINFYITIPRKYEHITLWSNTLNHYKSQKDYNNIELCIRDFMSFYSFDLIKYSKKDIFHNNIFIKNIKRWNDISESMNFNTSIKHSKIVILFMIYLHLKVLEAFDFLNELQPIEELLENNNYDAFIIYSINNNRSSILELVKKIPEYNIYDNIKRLYPNVNINNNLSLIKIIQYIKKNLNK